jgi:hypothetical protein
MNAFAVTSMTDFILSCEVLFFAGMLAQIRKARYSAVWFWSGMMLLLGLATLAGGIDHGFFQQAGLSRYFIQKLTWILMGLMTFFLLMTTASQFYSARTRRIILVFGIVQFIAYTAAILRIASFMVVIVNYAPVMLWLLVMCVIHMKKNSGFGSLIAGIVILFVASGIQRTHIDIFNPVDQNGLYHIISMVGIIFMYLGGKRLKNSL